MTIADAIRKANEPGPPENSVQLRVAATATVLVGIAACSAETELARSTALVGAVLIVAGMAFSYVTRVRPPSYIKVVAALGAVGLLGWFVHALSAGQITDIATVEDPLTILFVGIQVVHSFHVPARRDLIFSISGGAGLMALAAAQSIDLQFAAYALPWLFLTLWALLEFWRSASGGAVVSARAAAESVGAVIAVTLAVFVLLPAPSIAVKIDFVSRAGSGGPVPVSGALAGDAGAPSQLSKAGTPAGRTRIGGYLGFADHLDTALRGDLSDNLIMRVRAQRPGYWIGETYDRWDGQDWISTVPARLSLRGGSPFYIPLSEGDLPSGTSDLQTFYIENSGPNLVFHTEGAHQVWFPASSLLYGNDGTIVSPLGLGKGAVYTVESDEIVPDPGLLRLSDQIAVGPSGGPHIYSQLPHPYARAAALAQSVTAGATNAYDKVEALIAWIGSHTRYSTDIPPLPAGADSVNEFLFGNRVGFCEQISTALAVMLRTLGINAREVVGYVPGSYNPITDLYDVRANDAHAWVQVWFPGYGWQSFDPTAAVPLTNPSPGGTALNDVGHALSRIPPVTGGLAVTGAGVVALLLRWRRSRPRTWHARVVREMERAGRRCRRTRHDSETIIEYAAALDHLCSDGVTQVVTTWSLLASEITRHAYNPNAPRVSAEADLTADARRLRRATTRLRLRSNHVSRNPSAG